MPNHDGARVVDLVVHGLGLGALFVALGAKFFSARALPHQAVRPMAPARLLFALTFALCALLAALLPCEALDL